MSRSSFAALALGSPAAVVAVVGLWAFVVNPSGGWVWRPDDVTLPEAVATGNYAEVSRMLEAGVSPSQDDRVRATFLGSSETRVTPLEAAVWSRNPTMVRILMNAGAHLTSDNLAILRCLNAAIPNDDVRTLLDAAPAGTSVPCDQVTLPR